MNRLKSPISCAFVLLFTLVTRAYSSSPVLVGSPSLVVEHDWRVSGAHFAFGLKETAPIVAPPNQFFPDEQVIVSRTLHVYLGTWHTQFEGYGILEAIAALFLIASLLALAVFVWIRRKPENPVL